MGVIIMIVITAIAFYSLAMMICRAKTGKPDPEEEFRICWWKEESK